MSRIYRYRFEVFEDVVDENGHVNNVVYVQWMQDAAVRHSDSSGCTRATQECGSTWVVRSHQIEYLRPAFAGDWVEVLTWVSDFRRVRSLRKYKFVRVADGTILAKGATDWVFVAADTGRPRGIPENVRTLFELVPENQEP
jgi:acyl-CoA thioester hydrolase